MKKIAFFLMDLSGGGAERVMVNLARGFADLGLDVDLVLVKAEGPYLKQLPKNIRIVRLNSLRLFFSLFSLIKYLRQIQPSVLVSALEDTNFIALLASQLSGVSTQTIVTVHNNLSRESKNSTNLKRKLTPFLVKFFYPWADNIVAVSKGVAHDLIQIGLPEQKVTAIYNPIVTPDLQDKISEKLSHPWFAPGQPPILLGVGRLTKQKNFSLLVQAFAEVRKSKHVRLVLLGDGEERSSLEDLAKELSIEQDICFLSFVENPYIYMAQASALILSSAWEGFGNVLVEAMAVGTPVISTDCQSGPSEILDSGKYGLLVPTNDAEKLTAAIAELLDSTINQDILKQRAQEFTLEKAVSRYKSLFFD